MAEEELHTLLERGSELDHLSRAMRVIAHPLRLKILCTLGPARASVLDIVERIGTSQSNTSQHLGILRDRGILESQKDGNRIFYSISDRRTLEIVNMMRKIFCPH